MSDRILLYFKIPKTKLELFVGFGFLFYLTHLKMKTEKHSSFLFLMPTKNAINEIHFLCARLNRIIVLTSLCAKQAN